MTMPVNPKSKTLWLESLTVGGILFLLWRNGIAGYEVFFNKHKTTPLSLRFAAIVAKILPVRFNPVPLFQDDKDENGSSLEYYRADNLCGIVDRFCETELSGASTWLQEMSKCFISSQVMDSVTFVTLVLHHLRGREAAEPVIYLPGHYLNFLMEDFFKPQIRVKSIPSIRAFLRLGATPFALIFRTALQQIFHNGVRGNIRENPEIPAAWIELTPKSGVWNQLREFIATHSGGRTYDIVYYMDRTDTLPVPETTKELENQGFGWIDTPQMLHARLSASDYLKLMAGFIVSLRQRPFWFSLYLLHFDIRRVLYRSLYKRFNVRLVLQHQETSWIQEAQKQAIEAVGGIMIGLHWSNYPNTQFPSHLAPQHVMLVWGCAHREYLQKKGTCLYILPCGLWLARSGAKPEDINPPRRGNFTLAIFDDSFGDMIGLRAENISKFYLEILKILEDHPSFSGILKSKSYQVSDLRHLPAGEEIVNLIRSLEQQGRLRILDFTMHSPIDAAEAADLSVCFGLNSAGIIAGILGLRAIHWDCIGWLNYPIYRDKDQKVLFTTLSEVRHAVLRVASGDKTIGAFDKWRKGINYFDDCAGRQRILRFIDIYMQETGGGINGLDSAVKQYLSEHGGAVEFYEPKQRWW
ncbi:MAG: hypothetical protein ACYC6G_08280 [Desulfobaccales bacterium]